VRRNFDLTPHPATGYGSAKGFAEGVTYLREILACGGRQAIDYERLGTEVRVDNWCAQGEHPLLYEVGELQLARRILAVLRDQVGRRRFEAWGAHRLDHWTLSRVASVVDSSKSTVGRLVKDVDAALETILDHFGRLKPREV